MDADFMQALWSEPLWSLNDMPSDMEPRNKRSLEFGRRSFLLSGAAAATGALLPSAFSGDALAQQNTVSALLLAGVSSEALIKILEKSSGAEVKNGAFLSTTDTLAKLMAPGSGGRYDLMMSLSEISRPLILGENAGQERTIALDPKLVPNAAQVGDLYKNAMIARGNQTFAIPFYAGFDAVIYNREKVDEAHETTQSWGLIFSDRYAGHVAWQDEPYFTQMIAGLYLGHKDPARADRKEINEIGNFLISKKRNVRAMWQTAAQQINLMASGEIVAMHGTIPARVALQRRGLKITNNWPREGLVVWTGVTYVPKGSKAAEASQRVVNAMLSGEYGAALTRESGYLSASKLAEQHLSAEERKAAGYDITDRGLKTYPYAQPKDLNYWIESWGRVKSA